MTFVVLLPAGGTPVWPFDQSYDSALQRKMSIQDC